MSVIRQYFLWCDGPGDGPDGECEEEYGPGPKVNELRHIAKHRDGWTRRKANGRTYDFCPVHSTTSTTTQEGS